ncbi:hypothetical protein STCU_06992 [Strigomonas culicis]|nr:hypothetical protein STCU_06992 [Strigomonas culicis]|eukprot:EPY24812.1 hypothetical protein STCU_06992 [Strigomonas culicis]
MASSKSPFMRLLNSSGALMGEVATSTVSGSSLVQLLTGSQTNTATTLQGQTSFLRTLKSNGIKPLIAAPSSYWSGSTSDSSGTCASVGLFDTECSGTACPDGTASAYCNTFRKYITCDSASELYQYQIMGAFEEGLRTGSDLIYVQVPGMTLTTENVGNTLQLQSHINLLDNALGQLATTIVQRTKSHEENWNIVLVGATGDTTTHTVPFFTTVYSSGEVVQLEKSLPSSPTTADIRTTVLQWFNTETSSLDTTRLLGICSKGSVVVNCV